MSFYLLLFFFESLRFAKLTKWVELKIGYSLGKILIRLLTYQFDVAVIDALFMFDVVKNIDDYFFYRRVKWNLCASRQNMLIKNTADEVLLALFDITK